MGVGRVVDGGIQLRENHCLGNVNTICWQSRLGRSIDREKEKGKENAAGG